MCNYARTLRTTETLVRHTPLVFQRFLLEKINWKNRLIGIKGARGTGKTTLVLQWLKEKELPSSQAVFLTLDDLYFTIQLSFFS